jgi:hypothetical protein
MAHAIPCPSCATPVSCLPLRDIDAERRPALRAAIMERSLGRVTCHACGHGFREEPRFTLVDHAAGLYLAVWPAMEVATWKACAEASETAFAATFAASPGPAFRRVVFGWPALREKLLAIGAGIDDTTLELAKLGVIRETRDGRIAGGFDFRLIAIEGEELLLGWIPTGTDAPVDVLGVPRALIAEIESTPRPWQELRDALTGGWFVDYQRSLLAD